MLGGWVGRHRLVAGILVGVALSAVALAAVGYLVLADQRRSARVLAAALSAALGREIQIARVPELGPARVVMRGVRLPRGRSWPVEIRAEAVEASGPLVAAARGEAAPVRVVVTRPAVVTGAAGGADLAALEGVREALVTLLGSPAQFDAALLGGVLEGGGPEGTRPGAPAATFDLTLQKAPDHARGELLVRGGGGPPLALQLDARREGERVRLSIGGGGPLDPLAPWLPAGLVRARERGPLALDLQLALAPGGRAEGRGAVRLGAAAALDGTLAIGDGVLRVSGLRGAVELAVAAALAGRAGAVEGRAELADGRLAWRPGTTAPPPGGITVRVPEAGASADAVGIDVRLRALEARLDLDPADAAAPVQGELRVGELQAAGVALSALQARLRATLAGPGVGRAELSGLAARLTGAPLRGTLAYDVPSGRLDGQLAAEDLPLDALARRYAPGWLGPDDRLRAAGARVTARGVEARTLGDGGVAAELRGVTLRRPDGEAAAARTRLRATLGPASTAVVLALEQLRATLPALEGEIPRVDGAATLARAAAGVRLARASATARDATGREMLRAALGPRDAGRPAGPVRLTVDAPALERLASLWPSHPRQLGGTAALELDAPDARLGSATGRLTVRVPAAELLGGKLSLRDFTAELPVAAGGASPAAIDGPVEIGELVGYGVVAHDVAGRGRIAGGRLVVPELRYALYAGEGRATIDAGAGPDGFSARAHLAGDRVRIEEFMSAYGIRGGTMTGLLRYDLDVRYGGGRVGADGTLAVPEGGTVTIELLERLFQYTAADPTGVVRRALENLRAFDYKSADLAVRTASDDIRVSLSLRGRERFGIFPPRVKEINVHDMPLGFLARQFPGR